jgi:4-hydroxy-2-oxoheptanedioate aldolase
MGAGGTLSERLAPGRPLFSSWASLPGRFQAEILARSDCDAMTIDMQHGHIGFAQAVEMIAAVTHAGKPALARVPVEDFGSIGRLLDAGAQGIVVPMIETAAQAAACVMQAKYPPVGGRSWGPYQALSASGLAPADYLQMANGLVKLLVMVETRKGLEALHEIMAVPGIDGIFVGPSDLSISLSKGASADVFAPEPLAALTHVARECARAGLIAATYAASPEVARRMAGLGYRFITLGNDVSMFTQGVAASFAAARKV